MKTQRDQTQDQQPSEVISQKSSAPTGVFQQMANSSPKALESKAFQDMANNSPQVQQTAQLQAMANGTQQGQDVAQRAIKSRKIGNPDAVDLNSLAAIAGEYNITMAALGRSIKNKLFEGDKFSAAYQTAFDDRAEGMRQEMNDIVMGLNDLIAASNSNEHINANANEADVVGAQVVGILRDDINNAYLNAFTNYNIIHNLGDDEAATSYTHMIETIVTRANNYQAQIHEDQFDPASRKTNERMQNRLDKLATIRANALALRGNLDAAVTAGQDTDALMGQVTELTGALDDLENAWDLDWSDQDMDLNAKITTLGETAGIWGENYQDDGGEDDGMNVGDEYNSHLACSLYALLELKPNWLGAANPRALHGILRKTEGLQEYDDNQIAAKVRYLAGLSPTRVPDEMTLSAYLQQEADAGRTQSRIFDVTGMAHTFAASWQGGQFRKVDEATPNGGAFSNDYNQSTVLWVWE